MDTSKSHLTVLAIETSCDETSVAVVQGNTVLSNEIYSQLEKHKDYGGVVPGIAKLEHQRKLPQVLDKALTDADVTWKDITTIAVTTGPGLAIALEIGIDQAKELAKEQEKPLITVNHMEAHLWSYAVSDDAAAGALKFDDLVQSEQFPALGLLVSGGHTEFVLVHGLQKYERVGQTLDDACGEAFDKAAKMLGLGYPGGPTISKRAAKVRESGELQLEVVSEQKGVYLRAYNHGVEKYELPIAMARSGDLNVSYSGLKTAFKQLINNVTGNSIKTNIAATGLAGGLSEKQIDELCLMFEEAAVETLITKLTKAFKKYPEIKSLWLGGGVIANKVLRKRISELVQEQDRELRLPTSIKLMTDNAAMIGLVANLYWRNYQNVGTPNNKIYFPGDDLTQIDRQPNLQL